MEIKPCPFCGNRMTILNGLIEHDVAGYNQNRKSKTCPIGNNIFDAEKHELWNLRHSKERG